MNQSGYKWLRNDWTPLYGYENPWEIGVWKEIQGNLELCVHGYHACKTAYQSLRYVYGDRLVIIEAECIQEDTNKFVARRMRVVQELPTKEIMIEFAKACAKNVLYLYERKYPGDKRLRVAVETITYIDAAADAAADAAEIAYVDAATLYATYAAASTPRVMNTIAYAAYAANAAADAAYAAGAINCATYIYAFAYSISARKKELKWQEQKLEQIIQKYKEVKS